MINLHKIIDKYWHDKTIQDHTSKVEIFLSMALAASKVSGDLPQKINQFIQNTTEKDYLDYIYKDYINQKVMDEEFIDGSYNYERDDDNQITGEDKYIEDIVKLISNNKNELNQGDIRNILEANDRSININKTTNEITNNIKNIVSNILNIDVNNINFNEYPFHPEKIDTNIEIETEIEAIKETIAKPAENLTIHVKGKAFPISQEEAATLSFILSADNLPQATILYRAIEFKWENVVKYILENFPEADLIGEGVGPYLETAFPITLAITQTNPAIAKLVINKAIESGIDINHKFTLASIDAKNQQQIIEHKTLFDMAIEGNNLEAAKLISSSTKFNNKINTSPEKFIELLNEGELYLAYNLYKSPSFIRDGG